MGSTNVVRLAGSTEGLLEVSGHEFKFRLFSTTAPFYLITFSNKSAGTEKTELPLVRTGVFPTRHDKARDRPGS